MKRAILACVAGLVTWVVAASLLDRVLRLGIQGYAAAEPNMAFTLGMMAARLTLGALSSLISGAVVGWLAPRRVRIAWVLGAIMLAGFIPGHVALWDKFPLWYHLTFLVTLVPVVVLGCQLASRATLPAPVKSA